MRKLLTTFVCVWFTLAVWAGDGIYEKLQQIPQISEIQKLDVKPFQEYYPVSYTHLRAHETTLHLVCRLPWPAAVSYTHLTLPTNSLV